MSTNTSGIAADIASYTPPNGAVALWWLGQSGFALKGGGRTVYVDLFLSEGHDRLVPPPFAPEEAPAADLVLVTHEHLDHLDPGTLPGLAASSPGALFVAPEPVVEQVVALGIPADRVVAAQPGQDLEVGGLWLMPVPAMHGLEFPPVEYGFGREMSGGLYRYLGYVVELGGTRVYHSGDTLVFDGLVERLQELRADVLLLPINGRSYSREQQGMAGNMDDREAADLAAAVGASLLVPTHYEMFAANTGRPGALVEYARERHPELSILVPSHGRRFTLLL